MAAITQSEVLVYEQEMGPGKHADTPFGAKEIIVEVPETADDTDTFTVDLSLFGITTFKYIKGWTHSTAYNVVIVEAPTTAVSGTTLTVTVGGSTDNLRRSFLIGGI